MTRINVIPAADLTDRHLIAEYRELPRVFELARKWVESGRPGEIPDSYRLGSGHVRFFYPRTGFLSRRQAELIAEGRARGFELSHVDPPDPVPGADDDWSPPPEAVALNLERLRERLQARPELYRLRGEPVGVDFYNDPEPDPEPADTRIRYLAALRVRPLPATCHAYRFELHEDLADVQTIGRPDFEVWRVELPEDDEPGPVFVRVLDVVGVVDRLRAGAAKARDLSTRWFGPAGRLPLSAEPSELLQAFVDAPPIDLDDERHAGETARRFAYSSFGGMVVRDPVAYLPPGGVEPVAPAVDEWVCPCPACSCQDPEGGE